MNAKSTWIDRILDSEGAQDLLLDVVEQAMDSAAISSGIYESVIELAMAVAMCAVRKVNYPEFDFRPRKCITKSDASEVLKEMQSTGSPNRPLGCIFRQVEIGQYRVDFLVLHSGGGIVVECDGHDFHEKTKEQAANDKARDRVLQEHGFKVFHYTGSEIWRDAIKCAREALSLAHSDAVDAENSRLHIHSEGQFVAVVNALRAPF